DDVERAVKERQAGGHVEALQDGLDLPLSAIVLDRIDVAETEGTDKQRALVAPGHLARFQDVGGIDFNIETRRQLDLLHQGREFGLRCAGRRTGRWRLTFLSLGLVAEEPVWRRVGPEALGAGLIFFQRLLWRVSLAAPRHNQNGCERKNGSIESRFHRVT